MHAALRLASVASLGIVLASTPAVAQNGSNYHVLDNGPDASLHFLAPATLDLQGDSDFLGGTLSVSGLFRKQGGVVLSQVTGGVNLGHSGTIRVNNAEATHCNNIGRVHRQLIHEAFRKWYGIEVTPEKEYSQRRDPAEMRCWTDEWRQKL